MLLNLRNNFNIANYPKILDTTNIGVTIHDNLKSVLQKIVDNIKSNDTPETLINTIESSSIKLLVSGLNSHTLLASVKLSSVPGNVLASYSDGLFSPGYTPIYQNLDLTNNVLSISNGNYITLPSSGMQTIRLSPGNILTLSGNDSSVTLPSFDETPVTVNSTPTLTLVVGGINGHTITGNARISPSLNNQLTDSDGLYVSIGAAEVLSKISSDANLYNNVFLDLVSGVRLYNYRWSITNTTTITKEITYNNQYGVVTTVNVDAASSIFIVGYKITDFDAGLQINFLGQS